MEFYSKSYSQSKISQSSVLIKSEKENALGENTLSKQRRRTQVFALSLKQRERVRGSLTVGPGGPLVRFDRSSSPSLLSARTVRGSDDRRRRMAVPHGVPRAGMDPPDRGGPPGGC